MKNGHKVTRSGAKIFLFLRVSSCDFVDGFLMGNHCVASLDNHI
jgi:hypothetical protein